MTKLATLGSKLGGDTVTCREGVIFIKNLKLNSGTRSIIDDILLWSNNIPAILIYFEYVCRVLQKYRVSFRLDKCDFLKEIVEFVGHDLTADDNYPTASKFDMIKDWVLPTTGQILHSFVGLVIFYHMYTPYLEMQIQPLVSYSRHTLGRTPQQWLGLLIWWNYLGILRFLSRHHQS